MSIALIIFLVVLLAAVGFDIYMFTVNWIDALILFFVFAILALIIYFSFIRKKKGDTPSACKGCPYAKKCMEKSNLKENEECEIKEKLDKEQTEVKEEK